MDVELFYNEKEDRFVLRFLSEDIDALFDGTSEQIIEEMKDFKDCPISLDFLNITRISKIKYLENDALSLWVKYNTIKVYKYLFRKEIDEYAKIITEAGRKTT